MCFSSESLCNVEEVRFDGNASLVVKLRIKASCLTPLFSVEEGVIPNFLLCMFLCCISTPLPQKTDYQLNTHAI